MERYGDFSLKQIAFSDLESHRGNPGAPTSPKVLSLVYFIEEVKFWRNLGQLIKGDKVNRSSFGGLFKSGLATRPIDPQFPYTWQEIFDSLDNILKKHQLRAVEFLVRDFQPSEPNPQLEKEINSARAKALSKYPRLRRLFWEDYESALETPSFWRKLTAELSKIPQTVSSNEFFIKSKGRKRFWINQTIPGSKARIIDLPSFYQMVGDLFNEHPRSFLLEYTPKNSDPSLGEEIQKAKQLLEVKTRPSKEQPKSTEKIPQPEFDEILQTPQFWQDLKNELESYSHSERATEYFSYFLQYFNEKEIRIVDGRLGKYARFTTIYMNSLKQLRQKMPQPSKKLVHHLMWEFKSANEKTVALSVEVKALCGELFPQDCLYVAVQTPQFWKKFEEDIKSMPEPRTLSSFLRYFCRENTYCDRRKNIRGNPEYQKLHHRAYHKQKWFLSFLGSLGIKDVKDFRDGTAKLFWKFAPDELKPLLIKSFTDFDQTQKSKKMFEQILSLRAKNILTQISASGEPQTLHFKTRADIEKFRDKIQSVSRKFKQRFSTHMDNNSLTIGINPKVAK